MPLSRTRRAKPAYRGCVLLRKFRFGSRQRYSLIFIGGQPMLITNKVYSGSVNPEFKEAMRAHVLRLSLHFLVGIILGVFLLPEGAGIVLAAAAAAAGVKAFYDYLKLGRASCRERVCQYV